MHTYYELEFLGLEFHTLLSILTITHEMSVANVLLLEFTLYFFPSQTCLYS